MLLLQTRHGPHQHNCPSRIAARALSHVAACTSCYCAAGVAPLQPGTACLPCACVWVQWLLHTAAGPVTHLAAGQQLHSSYLHNPVAPHIQAGGLQVECDQGAVQDQAMRLQGSCDGCAVPGRLWHDMAVGCRLLLVLSWCFLTRRMGTEALLVVSCCLLAPLQPAAEVRSQQLLKGHT